MSTPSTSSLPTSGSPLVGVIMGSRSDWSTMQEAAEMLAAFGVPYEARVVSAHRTPELLRDYARTARSRGPICTRAVGEGSIEPSRTG